MAGVTLLVIRRRIFITHLLLFLLVMGMLAAINYTFSPAVIWYPFPLIGWGLAVALHFLFSVVWARESWAETRDEWRGRLFMQIFVVHLVVYLAVNSLLLFINLHFSPQMLWTLFPAAGWGAGLVMHLVLTLLWCPGTTAAARAEKSAPEDAAPDNNKQADTH
jgi:hypothetical protein